MEVAVAGHMSNSSPKTWTRPGQMRRPAPQGEHEKELPVTVAGAGKGLLVSQVAP